MLSFLYEDLGKCFESHYTITISGFSSDVIGILWNGLSFLFLTPSCHWYVLALFQVAREKVVQIMFETFNVTGLYAVEQAVLSLYSVGRISGCAVDVGHGKTGMFR